jgi:anthranilate/para-aminobenzoate synthase component II
LIDVDAKIVDDTAERKLAPRAIQDDQRIIKHKTTESLEETDITLKDDDLKESIWDEESIYNNDLEMGDEEKQLNQVKNENKKIGGLIDDVKVLNTQIGSLIENSKLKTSPVSEVKKNDAVITSALPKLEKKDTSTADKVTENSNSKKPSTVNLNDKTSQEKRKLTMFKDYVIKKRYTLNPEIDFNQEELKDMPKKPKQELVVGILTLPISHILRNKIRNAIKEKVPASEYLSYSHIINDMTFYPSSYAKWLEHNGVKTVPIAINQDITKIYNLIDHLDGLLLTGGATPLFLKNNIIQVDSSGVGSSTKIKHPSDYLNIVGQIIRYAKKKNLDKPFPVWGTCLGFEAIILDESRLSVTMSFVHNNNKNLPNTLQGVSSAFRLTSFLTPEELDILQKQQSSFYNHDYAFTAHNFLRNHWLNNQYDLIGTTQAGPTTIVSMIEHKTLPIYGVQFHPEKIIYENNDHNYITKDLTSKRLSNKLSLFFVSGKENLHFFVN